MIKTYFSILLCTLFFIPLNVNAEHEGSITLNPSSTKIVNLSSTWASIINSYCSGNNFHWDAINESTANLITVRSKKKTSCEICALDPFKSGTATLRYWAYYTINYRSYECNLTWDITVNKGTVTNITITATPAGGQVKKGTKVTLSTNLTENDAYILYSIDGTNPNYLYYTPIEINESCTLRAVSYSYDGGKSNELRAYYTVVEDAEATSISLPSSKTIYIGESETLTYTITPSNAKNSVTWKSADTSIATVSSSGVVTGKKEGSTNITVTTDNGKSASCRVYVEPKPIEPTKIEITTPLSIHLEVGYTHKIKYTIEPENATTTITWKSSDTSIATVSSDGTVKGIKQGRTYINAETANGLYDFIYVYVGGFEEGTTFYDTSSDDYDVTYKVTDLNAKTCEVSYCNYNAKNVVIPSSVMGYKVTSIGSLAFFYRREQLESVVLPNSVVSIGNSAFDHCEKLETITLPSSLTTIGNYAFQGCKSLKSISIPNSVISIGSHVFADCENMESATLSNSIKRIEYALFFNCTSLKNISGFNNVEYIGAVAFSHTPWFSNLPEGENYIGKVLLTYKGKMQANTKVKVKDGCTQIYSSDSITKRGWHLSLFRLPL